jgi:hypothetical protein
MSTVLRMIFIVQLFVATEHLIAGKESMGKTAEDINDELTAILNHNEPSIEAFESIGREIGSLSEQENKDRDIKLEIKLKAIDTLDRLMDPLFDPEKNRPLINIPPPQGTGGIARTSGLAPSEIKDDALRKQYEAALEANHKRNEYLNFQDRSRMLIKLWIDGAILYIRQNYNSEKQEKNRADRQIEMHISSKEIKQTLKSLELKKDGLLYYLIPR